MSHEMILELAETWRMKAMEIAQFNPHGADKLQDCAADLLLAYSAVLNKKLYRPRPSHP